MEHSFDIEIAEKVGVHAAIIYKHIKWWCLKNKANNVHFHDGYYWTYNSKKAFAELFPYMTERQVEYAINKLLEAQLIIKGNYNKSPYDKTLWYSDISCSFDTTEMFNQSTRIEEPIPYSKPQIENNKNDILSKDNISAQQTSETFSFGKPEKPKQRKSANTLECDNALIVIGEYTENVILKRELTKLVNLKKEIAGKQRYKFYCSTIKNYLDDLDETFGNDEQQKIEAVKLSIRYNGTTQVMKPNNINTKNNVRENIEKIGENDYYKYDQTQSEREF
ncbi:MAG: hypothetical protein IKP50_00105 [Bacilli bacterium]|nr:hypothetical protein [Bacilli bacterium]